MTSRVRGVGNGQEQGQILYSPWEVSQKSEGHNRFATLRVVEGGVVIRFRMQLADAFGCIGAERIGKARLVTRFGLCCLRFVGESGGRGGADDVGVTLDIRM